MVVCMCKGLTERDIESIRVRGATTVEEVAQACGAGLACGACHEALGAMLVGGDDAPAGGARPAGCRMRPVRSEG